jgi:glycosyltransferase involved in cell wall biosynthesis
MKTIDIIIPTFNRVNYLKETIDSVLKQTYQSINIIVSDNASTDGTEFMMKKYLDNGNVYYYKNKKNLGMSGNWDIALKNYSKSEIVMILSDDDYLIDSNYVKEGMSFFNNNEKIILVHSNHQIIDNKGNIIERYIKNLPSNSIGNDMFQKFLISKDYNFNLTTVIFKKTLVNQYSLLNIPIMNIDYLMFLILSTHGDIGYIPKTVSSYRIHDANESSSDLDKWYLNLKYIDEVENFILQNKLKIDNLEIWKKRMYKMYFKTRLAPRVLKSKSFTEIIKYIKFCTKNDMKKSIFSLFSIKNIYYFIWK